MINWRDSQIIKAFLFWNGENFTDE